MSWLDGELTTLAWCWRVERRDGVAIGLTSHDRDIVIDGLVHRASPGMTPSAIRREEGLEAETGDVAGALEKRFGRKLNVTVQEDPSLIGGIRVVVGDEVLDTSVKARLEQMKVALTA